jgi:hypothetical protein
VVAGELFANEQHLALPERVIARNGDLSLRSESGATVVLVELPE